MIFREDSLYREFSGDGKYEEIYRNHADYAEREFDNSKLENSLESDCFPSFEVIRTKQHFLLDIYECNVFTYWISCLDAFVLIHNHLQNLDQLRLNQSKNSFDLNVDENGQINGDNEVYKNEIYNSKNDVSCQETNNYSGPKKGNSLDDTDISSEKIIIPCIFNDYGSLTYKEFRRFLIQTEESPLFIFRKNCILISLPPIVTVIILQNRILIFFENKIFRKLKFDDENKFILKTKSFEKDYNKTLNSNFPGKSKKYGVIDDFYFYLINKLIYCLIDLVQHTYKSQNLKKNCLASKNAKIEVSGINSNSANVNSTLEMQQIIELNVTQRNDNFSPCNFASNKGYRQAYLAPYKSSLVDLNGSPNIGKTFKNRSFRGLWTLSGCSTKFSDKDLPENRGIGKLSNFFGKLNGLLNFFKLELVNTTEANNYKTQEGNFTRLKSHENQQQSNDDDSCLSGRCTAADGFLNFWNTNFISIYKSDANAHIPSIHQSFSPVSNVKNKDRNMKSGASSYDSDLKSFSLIFSSIQKTVAISLQCVTGELQHLEDGYNSLLQSMKGRQRSEILLENLAKLKQSCLLLQKRNNLFCPVIHDVIDNLADYHNKHAISHLNLRSSDEISDTEDNLVTLYLELFFECFGKKMNNVVEKIQNLYQKIVLEEEQMKLRLMVHRNRIMFMELGVNILELGLSIGTCISGPFGTDPDWLGGIQNDPKTDRFTFRNFYILNGVISIAFIAAVIFVFYLRNSLR